MEHRHGVAEQVESLGRGDVMRRRMFASLLAATCVCALCSTAVWSAPSATPHAVSQRGWSTQVDPELVSDTEVAIDGVDGFWKKNWSDFFTGSYQSPQIHGSLGFYDVSKPSAPGCGGEPAEKYNAFYCPSGDYLAWSVDFMDVGFNWVGDSWVYLIVAHEWGHAIQERLKVELRSVDGELQADCLAGAELMGATNDGSIVWEQGDTEEIVSALQKLGDATPWTNPSDHGDIAQRESAFGKGVQGGVEACLP